MYQYLFQNVPHTYIYIYIQYYNIYIFACKQSIYPIISHWNPACRWPPSPRKLQIADREVYLGPDALWGFQTGLMHVSLIGACFIMTLHPLEVSEMDEAEKAKIRSLSQNDIPITERMALYNHMGRRFKNPVGLKPGLLQKYQACESNHKERFKLLKEFLISEDMFCPHSFHFAPQLLFSLSSFWNVHLALLASPLRHFETNNFRGKRPMSKPTLSSQALS